MSTKRQTVLAFGVAILVAACGSESDDGGSGGSAGSGGGAGATGGSGGAAGSGGASGGSAGSTGGNAGAGGASPCVALCANTANGNCPNDPAAAQCGSECETARGGLTKCQSEYDAFLSCAAAQSADNLECDSSGITSVKSGVCATEIAAFQACNQ